MKNDLLKKSKMMILIRHLDEKEFKDLGLWLRSPIHNNSEKIIKLYDILKKKCYKSQKDIDTLTLMRSMEILPKGSKSKDISPKHIADLKVICSKLTIQIQDFLVWHKIRNEDIRSNIHLMDILLGKQLLKLVAPILNKTRKMQEASPLRDIDYCIDNYHLTEIDLYLSVFQRNRDAYAATKNTVDALQAACLSQLLRYYCAVSNARNIVKVNDEFLLMNVIKNFLKNNPKVRTFTVEIYYLLLSMLNDETTCDYYEFKNKLFENIATFDTNEFRQLLNFMSNYCLRMFREGNKEFLEEQFEVFEMGLQYDCWTTDVYFSPHLFVQITHTALMLKKIDWAYNFFSKYQDYLSPDIKKNILHYCDALLSFQKRAYDTAQTHLISIDNVEDFMYRIEYKILLIKIYYDNKELTFSNIGEHPIYSELQAIINYVQSNTNKKMSETVRQQYSNFANFFKRILNRKKKLIDAYEKSPTQSNLQALQKDLTDLNPLIERQWLEEKVKELMAALE